MSSNENTEKLPLLTNAHESPTSCDPMTESAHHHARNISESSSSHSTASTDTSIGKEKEPTPPSSPSSSGMEVKDRGEDQLASVKPTTSQTPSELLYVPLDTAFAQSLTWSNDPNNMAIGTYFTPDKPNLGRDFKFEGLKLVVRELEGMERFIMRDNKGRYYVWDEWDGRLFWARDAELEDVESDEEKIDWIICELGALEAQAVYRDYHPAEHGDLAAIRARSPEFRI